MYLIYILSHKYLKAYFHGYMYIHILYIHTKLLYTYKYRYVWKNEIREGGWKKEARSVDFWGDFKDIWSVLHGSMS